MVLLRQGVEGHIHLAGSLKSGSAYDVATYVCPVKGTYLEQCMKPSRYYALHVLLLSSILFPLPRASSHIMLCDETPVILTVALLPFLALFRLGRFLGLIHRHAAPASISGAEV